MTVELAPYKGTYRGSININHKRAKLAPQPASFHIDLVTDLLTGIIGIAARRTRKARWRKPILCNEQDLAGEGGCFSVCS